MFAFILKTPRLPTGWLIEQLSHKKHYAIHGQFIGSKLELHHLEYV